MQDTRLFAYAFYKYGRSRLCLLLPFIFSFFLLSGTVSAQNPPRPETDFNQLITELFPVLPEDIDDGEMLELFMHIYTNPLDINKVSFDELAITFLLSETQLQAFFTYRNQFGPFISLYELQAVPEFDLPTIQKLLPFITLDPRPVALREAFKNPGQHFLMLRTSRTLQTQKGFSEPDTASRATTRYLGNALQTYVRYRNARTGSHSLGVTLEKDAGEKFWDWNAKSHIFGADFSSFHGQILNRGRLKNLIAGDYLLQAGQGLVFGAGFSLGKGSEVIRSAYRSTLGLKPYTSAGEANFFRGMAATFQLTGSTEITLLYSGTKRDATVGKSDDGDALVSSLPVGGYHRTVSEMEKHNNLAEQNTGLHLLHKLSAGKGQLGFTFSQTHYALPVKKRDLPYNQYEFQGSNNFVTGLHGDYRLRNFHFFGESGISKSGGIGLIGGSIVSLGKKWDATVLVRSYARNFHSFYGNAISEATKPVNERGYYAGLRFTPVKKWQFSSYFDYFKFPWLRYQVDAPSSGFDWYLHALFKPGKQLNIYALFHEKHKQRNNPDQKNSNEKLVTSVRKTAMVNFEYEIPLKFSFRTRCQMGDSGFKKAAKSKGIIVLQDISWHISKVELSGRIAWFHTDDYDSRQYVYEKDVLYAFSIPAYSDVGTRHYMMLRYAISKKLKMWARWSQTNYRNLEKIGSGLSEINGNRKSDLKLQVLYEI